MRQEQFIARHQPEWRALEQWLDARGAHPRRARQDATWRGLRDEDVPAAYRRLCQQLGLARRRGYSPQLRTRLQALVQRGHDALYRPPAPRWQRVFEFFLADFPARVRAEAGVMAAALVLFALPLVLGYAGVQLKPELIHTLLPPQQIAEYESWYTKDAATLGRPADTNLMMFGFYVFNNVSAGLRAFASGLIVGIGPIVALAFNGVMIGAVAGHLQATGHGDPFWRFVVGHSSFELTAIVIAGGAGLRLGLGVLAPGRRRRVDALIDGGRRGAWLCLGVFGMLLIAAFIEAFWSAIGTVPAPVKYGVGAVLWTLVLLWLWRGGRDRHAA